jgi:hypothetical protein
MPQRATYEHRRPCACALPDPPETAARTYLPKDDRLKEMSQLLADE